MLFEVTLLFMLHFQNPCSFGWTLHSWTSKKAKRQRSWDWIVPAWDKSHKRCCFFAADMQVSGTKDLFTTWRLRWTAFFLDNSYHYLSPNVAFRDTMVHVSLAGLNKRGSLVAAVRWKLCKYGNKCIFSFTVMQNSPILRRSCSIRDQMRAQC